ncbi:MAG: DUF1302 domain-containing protein [Azonexus sp.]|jgi:hypothetical protein|nr:DUF1302 domain-containing protein [Azonexus sp.]
MRKKVIRRGARRSLRHIAAGAVGALLAVGSAQAFTFDSGNPDVKMSWDNTFKYSAGWRVRDIDSKVADNSLGPQINTNDGDMNFKKGSMISNRLDWLSEFDFRYQNKMGFRVSAAAWYDDVYQHGNDNPGAMGGALVNYKSVAYDKFPQGTKDLHGNKTEFRDAFVYGTFDAGESSVNVKAGQFTQLMGESLFFGYNGIAAAQTPLDLVRALSVPNSQFKEIAMPVKQISAMVQINPQLSVGAYYQFEFKRSRVPGAGSYFSFADFVDSGGQNILLGDAGAIVAPPFAGMLASVHRTKDMDAKNSGQGGAQIKFKTGDYEFGFYAAQFHDKMPQFYVRAGNNARGPLANGLFDVGDYMMVYAENIRTEGVSVSTLVGETSLSAELSFRQNMPLVARGVTAVWATTDNNNSNNPAYPVGDTLHFNMSTITVFGATPLWEGASLVAELAYNQRLKMTRGEKYNAVTGCPAGGRCLDPLATKSATAIQFVFQPEYFQVLPGLDLQVPIGVGYGIDGRSSVAGVAALMPPEHGGNISIGLKGEYLKTWQMGFNYTHYFGDNSSVIRYNADAPTLSYKNFHGDRDFVTLSIQRTF